MSPSNTKQLLQPSSLAVIGGKEAAEVIHQSLHLGFTGPIYPIHPYREEIHGQRCYRSLLELPQPPDATFIAVNRELTITTIRQLAAMNAGGAVCYASGFKETGSDELQQQLLTAAGTMPILGPNCYGLINYLDGIALWPDQHGGCRVKRGVAILTQSGNMAISLTMQRRALPIAYIATLGNQAQIKLSDMIMALLDDPRVSAIGLHIEGIDDLVLFEQATKRARDQNIPMVALKTGRSQTGQKLTLSHTASLAGSDQLIGTFLTRLGIARVGSMTALLETLKLLHTFGPLPNNRIATMSCSGGEAALLADAVEPSKLQFAPLSTVQSAQIKATLSDLVTVSNPLDYHTFIWGDEARLRATYAAVLGCNADLTLLVLDFPHQEHCSMEAWQPAVNAFASATRETGARTALLTTLPENLPESIGKSLMEQNITPLQGIDDAISAIEAAAFIGSKYRDSVTESITTPTSMNTEGAITVSTNPLDEWSAKQQLKKYGISVPTSAKVVATEVVHAAKQIGFPVVVKAVGTHLAHKTEQGAVALNLHNNVSVARAIERMRHLSDEFIVEQMIDDAVAELIVGVNHDPQFGLYLVIGSGGIFVELFGDSRVLLLPTSTEEITQALAELSINRLLSGYRSREPGDIEAVIIAVKAIARFALEHTDDLLELDINPLLVRPVGYGAIAVDALIHFR